MLLDLEIVNGSITPVFDKYTDIYTVSVGEDVDSLVINYELEDGYKIDIINNRNFSYGSNMVYLEVYNDLESNTYTLLVYKEESEVVTSIDASSTSLEVEEELPFYVKYEVFGVCFVIIIILFIILFKPKKR